MTDETSPVESSQNLEDIPNPDALGLIPIFTPPPGEEHPDSEETSP